MKRLLAAAMLLMAQGISQAGHSYFVVKTEDGREEMKVSCDGGDSTGEMDCHIRSTQLVVPDVNVPSQFSDNARRLSQGGDSLRVRLCGELHLIEPRVKEAREIVGLLRDACARGDARKLADAYSKMDTLSKKTCIVLNSEEYVKFKKGGQGTWIYESRNEGCFALKKYVMREGRVEKTIEYSNSTSIACLQERYIDKTTVLKTLTDGRVEPPGQCHYLYLE